MALAAAFALAGCVTLPLPLRVDPTALQAVRDLRGAKIAIAEVVDARGDKNLGGLACGRSCYLTYTAAGDPAATVRHLLEIVLRLGGAELTAPADADLVIAVDIEELTIKTTGPTLTATGAFGGGETSGAVTLGLRYRDKDGRTLADRHVRKPFGDDDRADAGMLGDAIRGAIELAVATMPAPPSDVARAPQSSARPGNKTAIAPRLNAPAAPMSNPLQLPHKT